MKKILAILSLIGMSFSAFADHRYECFSVDDESPYGIRLVDLTVNSASEVTVKIRMNAQKLVTERYVVDKTYAPRSPAMKKFLKFDVVDPNYDAYGEGPVTPFYVESALLTGGYRLRRGGSGGFIKTPGHGYSWARFLCVLQ